MNYFTEEELNQFVQSLIDTGIIPNEEKAKEERERNERFRKQREWFWLREEWRRHSKKERKYRNKIICENHINKVGQKEIDSLRRFYTYEEIYNNTNDCLDRTGYMIGQKLLEGAQSLGIPIKDESGYRSLKDIFDDLGKLWDELE